jgi:hypothetical protein
VSVGANQFNVGGDGRIEFVLASDGESARHVELVTMTAYYHTKHQLGVGHTLPIGESWLQESACNHLLVSVPYPWGPDLEELDFSGELIRFLWLLPITEAEKNLRLAYGLEALEQRFDDAAIRYWDPERQSVA